MTIYQLVSLYVAIYSVFGFIPLVHAIIQGHGWIFSLKERLIYTAIWVNLVMSFVGVPW